MPKYVPSDDGKVIDGKIVVFLNPTQWPRRNLDRSAAASGASSDRQGASGRTDRGCAERSPLLRGVRTGAPGAGEARERVKAIMASMPSSNDSRLKIWR
jgi:hypothetical protein